MIGARILVPRRTRAAGGRLVLRAPRLLSRVLTSRVERLHTLRQRDRDRRGVAPPAGSFTLLRLGWRSGTMSDGNRMIRAFSAEETLARAGQLAEVLLDCIAGGASVSVLEDFSRDEATEYWRAIAAEVRADRRVLFAAGEVDWCPAGAAPGRRADPVRRRRGRS